MTPSRSRRDASELEKAWSTTGPSAAIDSTPATLEVALLIPEASPTWRSSTALRTVVVNGATLTAMPKPSTTTAGKNPTQ